MATPVHAPVRQIGAFTTMLVVVASMIGTGVFTTTGYLVRDLGSLPAVLAAWVIGGVVALFGALAYAELVAALPHNGGEYQLLSRIYHPAVGFTSGWTSLVVGFSAPIAASAIAFGSYLHALFPVIPEGASALTLVGVMSVIHAVRVTVGGRVQNALTVGKVVLILVFVAGGLAVGDLGRITTSHGRPFAEAVLSPDLAIGLIYVSFAYSGWNAATYIAGEVRRPERSLPLALLAGTLLVTLVYLALNVVFLASAPASDLSGVLDIGHVAAVHLFGQAAGRLLTATIALGLVSTVGALIMTGPRVYEAMGRDHAWLRPLATRSVRGGPVVSIAVQALMSGAMVLSTSFDTLLTYIGFTLSLFAALTVVGVFVLRVREPGLARPYRTWGYPLTPIMFVALMGWMIVYAIAKKPEVSIAGFVTLAAGFVVWAVGTRLHAVHLRRRTPEAP